MSWVVYETDDGFHFVEAKAPDDTRYKVVSIHETELQAIRAMPESHAKWQREQNERLNNDGDSVFPLPLYPHLLP